MPSELKSATTTSCSSAWWGEDGDSCIEGAVAFAGEDHDVLLLMVGNGKVDDSIAIEIAHCDACDVSGSEGGRRAEGAVTVAEQDGEAAVGSVGAAECDVGVAVAVEVGEQDLHGYANGAARDG